MKEHGTRFPEPTAWYDRLALRFDIWEDCEGVPLAVASFRHEVAIRARMAEALRLLARYAPVDFARLLQLMRGIVVTRLYESRAQWRPSLSACVIATDYVLGKDGSPSAIAASIIHELTHARLNALGFDYREERRARVERICCRASEHFLERLPSSPERDAAIADVHDYLSLPDATWSDAAREQQRKEAPWYVRTLRLLGRLPTMWHRDPPT